LNKRAAELLLAGVIIARSTSLLFTKSGLSTIGVFNLLGVRFCVAFLILCLIFFKKIIRTTKKDFLSGLALGAIYTVVMIAETFAVRETTTSNVSFLENTAIVIVPIAEALLIKNLPSAKQLLPAAITLVGVGFMTLRGAMGFGVGELLCMVTALTYACAIIMTDRLSRRCDPLLAGIFQVCFMGVFTVIATFIFETPRMPNSSTEWGIILMLALVCSCFGFTLQPVAQKYVPSTRASQFCALNPLTATILSVVVMKEPLGIGGAVGAALILTGILMQTKVSQKA